MTSANETIELTELQALMDACGADVSRWPQQHRRAAEARLASSAEARAMLNEARTLDRLLDRAPLYDAKPSAELAARIVARALSERPARTAPQMLADNVVPLRRATAPAPLPPVARVLGQRRAGWQTGGVLAASLVLGLLIGGFGLTASMLDIDEDDTVAAVSGDGLFTGLEEDRI